MRKAGEEKKRAQNRSAHDQQTQKFFQDCLRDSSSCELQIQARNDTDRFEGAAQPPAPDTIMPGKHLLAGSEKEILRLALG
jgi:hypothetical protein